MLSDSAFWRIQNDTGCEKTFPAKYTQRMLREVAGAGIVGEDGYTMRVGYVATHPTNNVETPTEQPLLRRAKPVGAVRACLQFGGLAPFPLGLGQLAQRERGWGEGSKQLKHWKLEFQLINIAIHRKFQTRRVAEDSTRLYGEAAQHRMRLSVDGYNCLPPPQPSLAAGFALRGRGYFGGIFFGGSGINARPVPLRICVGASSSRCCRGRFPAHSRCRRWRQSG